MYFSVSDEMFLLASTDRILFSRVGNNTGPRMSLCTHLHTIAFTVPHGLYHEFERAQEPWNAVIDAIEAVPSTLRRVIIEVNIHARNSGMLSELEGLDICVDWERLGMAFRSHGDLEEVLFRFFCVASAFMKPGPLDSEVANHLVRPQLMDTLNRYVLRIECSQTSRPHLLWSQGPRTFY